MADTRAQLAAEDWVRRTWMQEKFEQTFSRERIPLSSGGVFDFDAVSADGRIAACISTSGATTATGRYAVGKILKIRSDVLFLLLTDVERRIVVLTEPDMFARCLKEADGGRVPKNIEFILAELPPDLRARVSAARAAASSEVSGDDLRRNVPTGEH